MSGLEIVPLEGDAGDVYARRHPRAGFFHASAWARALAARFPVVELRGLAARNREGAIVGIAPAVRVGRGSAAFLSSLPGATRAEPIGDDPGVETRLRQALVERARAEGLAYVEIRGSEPTRRETGAPRAVHASYRIDLAGGEEETFRRLDENLRWQVRRARRGGVEIAPPHRSLDGFHPLYAQNARRHGTPPLGRAFFEALLDAAPDLFIVDATDASGPIASILFHVGRTEAHSLALGIGDAGRTKRAGTLALWEAVRFALRAGTPIFDAGRSQIGTGPARYKLRFGARETPLAYDYELLGRSAPPDKNPRSFRSRVAARFTRLLPAALLDRLEPWLPFVM